MLRGVAGGVANSAGTISAGSNIAVTGSGTTGSPYVVSLAGGSLVETMQAGQVFSGDFVTNSRGGFGLTAYTGTADRLEVDPMYFDRTVTVTQASVYCVTNVAAALGKIVIYTSDANGWPSALVFQSANLDLSTVGAKTVTFAYTFLANTTYWVGFHSSSTAQVRAISPISTYNLSAAALASTTLYTGCRLSLAFASAAPNPFGFTAATRAGGFNPPSIFFTVA